MRPTWRSRRCPACAHRRLCRSAHAHRISRSRTPARAGTPLPYLVPQTDHDGLELAGVRLPDIAAPLATYTGWNYRNPAIGGADQLYPLLGSYIPFPATVTARAAAHDPRAAITERYASKQEYLDKVRAAGDKLVAERYLLAEDLPGVLERAGEALGSARALALLAMI